MHCDLAARNILISDGFVLKISDFGMARDISGKSYYHKSPEVRYCFIYLLINVHFFLGPHSSEMDSTRSFG